MFTMRLYKEPGGNAKTLAGNAHSYSSIRGFFAFFCTHFFHCITHRLATFCARLFDVKSVDALHGNLVGILFHALDGYCAGS